MEYSLQQVIRQIQIGECSIHQEENLTNICLDTSCPSYFQIICSQCILLVHPEHSSKLFKPVKPFLSEISELIDEQIKLNIQKEEVKLDNVQKHNLEQLQQILKEIKIIGTRCLYYHDKLTEEIQEITNPNNNFFQLIKDYFEINAKKIEQNQFQIEVLDQLKNKIAVNKSDLKIIISDNNQIFSNYLLLDNIKIETQLLKESITSLENCTIQNYSRKEKVIGDSFQIADFQNSLIDVKQQLNKFNFTSIKASMKIISRNLKLFKNKQIQVKISGNFKELAFIIGLQHKESLNNTLFVFNICSNNKNKKMLQQGQASISDFLKDKTEIILNIKVDMENNLFEIFDHTKTVYYQNNQNENNVSSEMIFSFISCFGRAQQFEILNINVL